MQGICKRQVRFEEDSAKPWQGFRGDEEEKFRPWSGRGLVELGLRPRVSLASGFSAWLVSRFPKFADKETDSEPVYVAGFPSCWVRGVGG